MHMNLNVCNDGAFLFGVLMKYSFWLCKSNALSDFCACCAFVVLITLYTSWREFCSNRALVCTNRVFIV
jgi:hypothetical protein